MIQEALIPQASQPSRSAWFYIAWSCGALLSSFFILPAFFYQDTGPTCSHFSLPGAFISVGIASICTWAFFSIPFRQIFPKLVSVVILVAGLCLGFEAVFTYVVYTWNPYGSTKETPSINALRASHSVAVSSGLPSWVSNTVLSITLYRPNSVGVESYDSKYSLSHPKADSGSFGSPGYGLMERWVAADTNGFRFVFVRKYREQSDWFDETNVVVFPYHQTAVTNNFGDWIIVGQFKYEH